MKQLTGNQVRQLFLDYFKSKGHMVEPSASLVPINDPTLLWINSGVAALKKYFDGSIKPSSNRITNAQKSIRTNDIENVGKTARHHTFFEMLGNFSIGDYFKEDAILFAWEFLTSADYIGFEKNKMYVTVHPDDIEAYTIWTTKTDIDPAHILKTYDNYWQIGEGPCGPNSEIFYDRGNKYDPENLGEKLFFDELENDRYIEVWNVVFSQYDGKEGVERKDYKELPQKNIDTGMGLERLVCIMQDGETNFDTDLFMPIIDEISKYSTYKYEGEYKMAYRVICDHIRTVTFAISDGALFSNEGRGYVLRRILRRAVRYGIKLGIKGSFMYKLVDTVVSSMNVFYPYLNEKAAYVSKLVKIEEERFHSTLSDGEKLLKEVLAQAKDKTLEGSVVFKLYDTYGFPFELTSEIASESGYTVDEVGFKAEMEKQRERARNAREEMESMTSQSIDLMNFTKESTFVGYDVLQVESAKVIGLFKNGVSVEILEDEGEVIFDQTPFYAESGGQIADSGTIENASLKIRVIDVKKAPQKQPLHKIVVESGVISLNDICALKVDAIRRGRIKSNHSAVHLLQSALRAVLGDQIGQAGSFVSEEYARFDFTHFEKVSFEQLREVEKLVNKSIFDQHCVNTEIMNIEDAKKSAAIALFDEKYESDVRVVSMGDVSIELCGGTHVSNTQEIGVFKIVSEESIGSGVRRITFVTKAKAYEDFLVYEDTLRSMAASLNLVGISNLEAKLAGLLEEKDRLQQKLSQQSAKLLTANADELLQDKVLVDNGLNIICKVMEDLDGAALKTIIDRLKTKMEDGVVFLASKQQDKLVFVVYCSKKANELGFKAGQIAKEAAVITAGNGGGRDDVAQSGGKDVSKLDDAMQLVKTKLGLML